MREGNSSAALSRLDEARRSDADGSVLAKLPEVRKSLFNSLLTAASKAIAAQKLKAAEQIVRRILSVEPNHPQARAMVDKIATLRSTVPPTSFPPASYKVRRGDTLWSIAAARYGNPNLWPRIYNANRDRIANPNLITPSQTLLIPGGSTEK